MMYSVHAIANQVSFTPLYMQYSYAFYKKLDCVPITLIPTNFVQI